MTNDQRPPTNDLRPTTNDQRPSGSELVWMSASDLIRLYRRRVTSPVEVTRAVLQQIDALNGAVNAFCFVAHDDALVQALRSEERWMRGEPLGVLDGVPVSIKDLLLTRG